MSKKQNNQSGSKYLNLPWYMKPLKTEIGASKFAIEAIDINPISIFFIISVCLLCFCPEISFAVGLEGEIDKVGGLIATIKKYLIPAAAIFGSVRGIFTGNWASVAAILGACLLLSAGLGWIDSGMTIGRIVAPVAPAAPAAAV